MLAEAAAELADQLGHIAGVVVEHKRFGVAVHYRNAARDRVGEVAAAVRGAGQRTALRVTTGREVIELRPNVDWDKGKTLRWVLDHIRDDDGSGRAAADLPRRRHHRRGRVRRGATTTVSRSWCEHGDDGDRATAAGYALDNPDRVREFTERLARQLTR